MDLAELDFPFTTKEVKAAILSSKKGKSSSDDLILNEMLKSDLSFILSSVNTFFNSQRYGILHTRFHCSKEEMCTTQMIFREIVSQAT